MNSVAMAAVIVNGTVDLALIGGVTAVVLVLRERLRVTAPAKAPAQPQEPAETVPDITRRAS